MESVKDLILSLKGPTEDDKQMHASGHWERMFLCYKTSTVRILFFRRLPHLQDHPQKAQTSGHVEIPKKISQTQALLLAGKSLASFP